MIRRVLDKHLEFVLFWYLMDISWAKSRIYILFIGTIILLFFAATALAQGTPRQPSPRPSLPTQASDRLEGARLRACQQIEHTIKIRSERLVRHANTILVKFDAISQRVMEYYSEKLVAEGKTVSNYESLVAEVQAKKDIAVTSIADAQANLIFSCTDNNPRAGILQFNENMKGVLTALQEYRLAIKNLIVSVNEGRGR